MRRAAPVALLCIVALASCSPSEVGSTVTTSRPLIVTTTTVTTSITSPTTGPPTGSGSPAWLLGGPEGLTDVEGETLLATSTPVDDLTRDKNGGYVFMVDDGLYWLRSGETEPVFVADVHGELTEVVYVGGSPRARIGVCDATDVDLTTGSIEAAASPGMVEADCGVDSSTLRWSAENGLTVRIVPALTTTVTESGETPVVEPARLEVSRAGQDLFDVPVGGFYQEEAHIEDFDGRWIVISRRPFESDDLVATFFVMDLATGTSTTFTADAAAATLLGADSEWAAAALPPTGPPFDTVPLLSDDKVSELADGRYVGYIDHVFTEGYRGGPEIHFDLGVWFSGPEAEHFAQVDGADTPGDYYIRNEDPTVLVREVSPHATVSSVWLHNDGDEGFEPVKITFDDLVTAMEGDSQGAEVNMRNGPWWLTIEEGVVVSIDEQYVP